VPLSVVGDPGRLQRVVILLTNLVQQNVPNLMSIKTEMGYKREKRRVQNKISNNRIEKIQYQQNLLVIEVSYLELQDYA
jgi:hypothetical protein